MFLWCSFIQYPASSLTEILEMSEYSHNFLANKYQDFFIWTHRIDKLKTLKNSQLIFMIITQVQSYKCIEFHLEMIWINVWVNASEKEMETFLYIVRFQTQTLANRWVSNIIMYLKSHIVHYYIPYSHNGLLALQRHMTKSSSSVKMKPRNEKSKLKFQILIYNTTKMTINWKPWDLLSFIHFLEQFLRIKWNFWFLVYVVIWTLAFLLIMGLFIWSEPAWFSWTRLADSI